jgi:DNA-3-methyladenine glycosylase II
MADQNTDYYRHLSRDKKFAKILADQEPVALIKRKDVFLYLCYSIMSQQLSTKVASVIKKRFLNLYKGKPGPEEVLTTPFETFRSIGLSGAKANYIHNVARFAIEYGMDHKKYSKRTNEEIIEDITRIKGVGRWTAEMLLMFTLGREDVFAADDLGIQQAMIRIYKLDHSNKKKLKEDMLRISAFWSPYRTLACLHLWQHKDK